MLRGEQPRLSAHSLRRSARKPEYSLPDRVGRHCRSKRDEGRQGGYQLARRRQRTTRGEWPRDRRGGERKGGRRRGEANVHHEHLSVPDQRCAGRARHRRCRQAVARRPPVVPLGGPDPHHQRSLRAQLGQVSLLPYSSRPLCVPRN